MGLLVDNTNFLFNVCEKQALTQASVAEEDLELLTLLPPLPKC